MSTTKFTRGGTQIKTFVELLCTPSFASGLHQRFTFFSPVYILLSITPFVTNSLIIVALHKESSLHPPYKLHYHGVWYNNWSVGRSCCPASQCYLLDVLGFWRSLHHGLCIVFSVFDDDDGHKRVQTSRPVVGAEVQTNCNFEAHIYHCSYHLDFISCLFFMRFTWWSYNFFVPSHNYTSLLGYFTRIIYKDFSHSQISSGSGRRSRSTTAEPTKCTEHSSIQKSSV